MTPGVGGGLGRQQLAARQRAVEESEGALRNQNVERPAGRVESLDRAIDTIPYNAIAGFLSRPTIFAEDEIDALPYIVDIYGSHTGD